MSHHKVYQPEKSEWRKGRIAKAKVAFKAQQEIRDKAKKVLRNAQDPINWYCRCEFNGVMIPTWRSTEQARCLNEARKVLGIPEVDYFVGITDKLHHQIASYLMGMAWAGISLRRPYLCRESHDADLHEYLCYRTGDRHFDDFHDAWADAFQKGLKKRKEREAKEERERELAEERERDIHGWRFFHPFRRKQ